jgi:hypothetical protein
MAWHLQNRHSSTPPVHFALVVLEMGSYELFAQADLKPSILPIPAFQVTRIIDMSHQHSLFIFYLILSYLILSYLILFLEPGSH